MNEKLKNLLDKINFNKDYYDEFKNAKIEKINVFEDKKIWDIIISNDTNFSFNILKEFITIFNLPYYIMCVKLIKVLYLKYFNSGGFL